MVFYCGNATRFYILIMSTVCLSLAIANSLALNFTIICMYAPPETPSETTIATTTNSTTQNQSLIPQQKPMFTPFESNLLFSGVAIGSLIGTLPITTLMSWFGLRNVVTVYGLLSSVATLSIPLATNYGVWAVLVARILQGVPVGVSSVSTGTISAEWSPLAEFGLFLALISCHLQFGPIITMPLAGQLCESPELGGWATLYYGQGALSLAAFLVFFVFYRDSPKLQRNVSHRELSRIERGKNPAHATARRQRIPYGAMACDRIIWVNIIAMYCGSVGFHTFVQYGPTFLSKALGYPATKTGWSAAFPYLLSIVGKMTAGPVSDRITLSDRTKSSLFASASLYGMAACYLGMSLPVLFGLSNNLLIQCFFSGVTFFSGLNTVGVTLSIQLIARQFANVLFACYQLQGAFNVLVLPIVVELIAPESTITQWSYIFVGVACISILGVSVFNLCNDVTARPWTFQGGAHKKRAAFGGAVVVPKKSEGGGQIPLAIVSTGGTFNGTAIQNGSEEEEAFEEDAVAPRRFRTPTVEGMSIH